MAANLNTLDQVVTILRNYVDRTTLRVICHRLFIETVPSGNKSYDETIRRLCCKAAS